MYALIRPDKESGLGKGESVTAAYAEAYSNYDNFVKNAFPNWKSVTYPTNDECFQAVSAGEADCVLVCNFRLFEMESVRERYHLTAVPTGESMGLSFAVRASDSELYSILNKTANLSDIQMEDAVLSAYSYLNRRVSMVQFLQDNWALSMAIVSSVFLILLLLLNQKLMAERKANRQQQLVEDALRRELQQQEQLQTAKKMAYTDPLTRVKSKHAFVEAEQRMNQRISEGTVTEFAVAMFDVNDLKKVNDTMGHEAGDRFLQDACKMICVCFKHSPVFRIGGDEFVAILENGDYAARDRLYSGFQAQMEENRRLGGIVISSGMALFRPGEDKSIHTVFKRADEKMYQRKRMLKTLTPDESTHPAEGNE